MRVRGMPSRTHACKTAPPHVTGVCWGWAVLGCQQTPKYGYAVGARPVKFEIVGLRDAQKLARSSTVLTLSRVCAQ